MVNVLKITILLSLGWTLAHALTLAAAQFCSAISWPHCGTLFYLPHGVGLLAAWAYGWRSVFYLMPAIMLLPDASHYDAEALYPYLTASLLALISGPLSLSILRCIVANEHRFQLLRLNWRILVLSGLIATVLSSVGLQILVKPPAPLLETLLRIFTSVLCDMFGLMLVLLFLMLCFRWVRLRKLAKPYSS